MKIESQYPFCVACFETGDNTKEHLILESIGGLLWARILCAECNNRRFGGKLDSEVKTDPQIRWAVEQLRDQIPTLYQTYNSGNLHLGTSKDGPSIKMISMRASGDFRMIRTEHEDGSILQSTIAARLELKQELERSGRDQVEIAELLNRFDRYPNDLEFEIVPGLSIIKRDVEQIHPSFSSELISERLIAKFGYTHFCLCITPDMLMRDRAYFDPIADFIRGCDAPDYLNIRRGVRGKYQPNHIFRVQCDTDRTTLKFQLFGAIGYDVVFDGLSIRDTDYPVIIHDLVDRKVYLSRNWSEFQRGSVQTFEP